MKIIKHIFILLLLPVLILSGFYGILKLFSRSPEPGARFTVGLNKEVSFPWDDPLQATVGLNLLGFETNKTPSNINIVLMIDNSSSMSDMVDAQSNRFSLSKNAVAHFIDNFTEVTTLNAGLIFFGDSVNFKVPLTSDLKNLKKNFWSITL